MIHLYCGDGKGKTTAAVGLAVRAAGAGMRVRFVQFFKSGRSSEMNVLSALPNVDLLFPEVHYGRFRSLTEEQKAAVSAHYAAMLADIREHAADYGLIVLDESVSACRHGMISREALLAFLAEEGQHREIVLTGREPPEELVGAADYVTEMRKIRHPFEKGIRARKGVEF